MVHDCFGRLFLTIVMGGGAYAGNWTPAAEFNIWVDAEAAYKVFHTGIDLHMVGVNLTIISRTITSSGKPTAPAILWRA